MNVRRLLCSLGIAVLAAAVGPTAIAAKSESCAHCHGTDGNSSSGAYPKLAGQTKEYLFKQIMAFKTGVRTNPMMSSSVGILTEQDAADLAEYFSSQPTTRSRFQPDPALAAQGKQLAGEVQCVACHQPGFKGLGEFPKIARQHYPYLVKQLKDYRDGVRTSDGGVMAGTVKNLTDEQIDALAHYLTGM